MWNNYCNSSWVCCYVTRVISLYVSFRRCLSPLCCLAGETWTSRGLCVDPSSGMESLSVKSVSADGPGPAGSSTTPTHAPICAHSQLTAMQNILSLPGTRSAALLQMKQIYMGLPYCVEKVAVDLVWPADLDTRSGCSQRKGNCCGLWMRLLQRQHDNTWSAVPCGARPAMLAIPVARSRSGQQLTIVFECWRCSSFSGNYTLLSHSWVGSISLTVLLIFKEIDQYMRTLRTFI